MKGSVVYFIRQGDNGPVKIGLTSDLDTRLASLRVGSGARLEVLRTLKGARRMERWLHMHYAAGRQSGEWFEYCPTMLTIVPGETANVLTRIRNPDLVTPVSQKTVGRMVKYATAMRAASSNVASAAALLGIPPRRLIGFLRGEIQRVWADELNDARLAYRALLGRQEAECLHKLAELRAEAKKVDDEIQYDAALTAHMFATRDARLAAVAA